MTKLANVLLVAAFFAALFILIYTEEMSYDAYMFSCEKEETTEDCNKFWRYVR